VLGARLAYTAQYPAAFLKSPLGLLSLSPQMLAPFPGFIAAVLALLAVRADRRTGSVAVVVGVLLVGWILVELTFIRELSFFHPLYAALGFVLVRLGSQQTALLNETPPRTMLAEVVDVLVDLPRFVTAPLYRSWHLRWGATEAEVDATMPGDELLPRPAYDATRAIDIDAAPADVWPWLVQVGCLRAGFYSDDLLDNLAHPSSREIDPQLQHLAAGSLIPMSPNHSVATSFRVRSFDVNHRLLWAKPDSTLSWTLTPRRDGGTRLVTRIRATYDWSHPLSALTGLVLLEFGDFAMLRRMLRGIKERAESRRSSRAGQSAEPRSPA
jgi:hypothetical protein